MIEQKLEQLKSLKQERLSMDEAHSLRAHIAHLVVTHPVVARTPLYQRAMHHGLRVMLSTFIFMIFVAGSVSVVADNALPGDPLYAFKVNVNEEIRSALLSTSEKKAAYQTNRIDTRLNEIKTLAETKTLTKAKQVTVQKALDDHITALSKELDTASTQDALKVTNDLEANLKAQKASIETSADTSDTEKSDVLEVYDNALMKVSQQEVQIISKEIDSIESDVQNTDTNTDTDASTTETTDTPPSTQTDTTTQETTETTTDPNTTPLAP